MSLTAEQIEKSDKEFEAWFDEEVRLIEHGCAFGQMSAMRFAKEVIRRGWLARQETICVELPRQYYFDTVMNADKVRASIEAAGIAHK